MKEIRAYIQPFKLNQLTQKLLDIPNFPGISVSECRGFGPDMRPEQQFDPYDDRYRVEIFAPDDFVDTIIAVLAQEAHTGRPGDGVISILEVQECLHIRTGSHNSKFP